MIEPAKIVCYAPGDRCLGCPHYHGETEFCEYKDSGTDAEKAIAFCSELFRERPTNGVFDWDDLQFIGEKHGVLVKVQPREACGEIGACDCASFYDNDEFKRGDVDCYRRADFLSHAETENDENT